MEDKNKRFGINLSAIEILKYSQYELLEEYDKSNYPLTSFDPNFQIKIDEEASKISVIINITVRIRETKEAFVDISIKFTFNIKFMENIVLKYENNKYKVLDIAVNKIVDESISTSRGILFERLRGTVAQNELLPIISLPSKFVEKENKDLE